MFVHNGKTFEAEEVGVLELKRRRTGELSAGNVGYLIAGVKDVHDTKVGDTITHAQRPVQTPWPGYNVITSYSIHYTKLYDKGHDQK